MNDQNDMISRAQAKDEIAAWATVINKPQYLNREDAMHVLDTLPAVTPTERTGRWEYTIVDNGSCSYSVTAKCSECGWDWFSKDGVGNYSAVFGAFITNFSTNLKAAEHFLIENAKKCQKMNCCPICGAHMREGDEHE